MDAATMRAWGRDNGWTVSAKGPLPQGLSEAYDAAHPAANGAAAPPAGPDYTGGVTDADFVTEADEFPDPGPGPDAETPPRRPAPKAGLRSTGQRLSARLKPGGKRGGTKGKPKPRVSTSELFGSAWRIGAKLAQPMPPMYRTLRLQSVVAGPLIDDAIKGTVVDPWLQPLARLTHVGETISALILPPAAIGAMAFHVQQTEGQPNPVVMQACAEALRHGLISIMRVGGDAFAEQLARERDEEEKFGGSVDMVMAWIMSEPMDPGQEEANIARMTARFAGQPDPEPAPA